MPPYTRGLHQLSDSCFAWFEPDGTWGFSNAGLIRGEGASVLVDTLFDVPMTRVMLDGMRAVTESRPIATVVNTHANGDHWYGNQLLGHCEIVASRATAAEMPAVPPALLTRLRELPGTVGEFARAIFGPFDWSEFEATLPTKTFNGWLDLTVGGVGVQLIEVGPAHTSGDVIAYVPSDKTVYTGDIVFVGGTPVVWAGPIANWVRACDTILALDADVVVPGHGPATDKSGVLDVRDYLVFVEGEATARFHAGMNAADAAADIDLGRFGGWSEHGRLAQNVVAVYKQLDPSLPPVDVVEVFRRMAALEGAAR
jgi:cyclase